MRLAKLLFVFTFACSLQIQAMNGKDVDAGPIQGLSEDEVQDAAKFFVKYSPAKAVKYIMNAGEHPEQIKNALEDKQKTLNSFTHKFLHYIKITGGGLMSCMAWYAGVNSLKYLVRDALEHPQDYTPTDIAKGAAFCTGVSACGGYGIWRTYKCWRRNNNEPERVNLALKQTNIIQNIWGVRFGDTSTTFGNVFKTIQQDETWNNEMFGKKLGVAAAGIPSDGSEKGKNLD